DDQGTKRADTLAEDRCRAGLLLVLDPPRLLVHEVRAAQAEVHLRVLAEPHRARGGSPRATAPAPDSSVTGLVDVGNLVGTHLHGVSDAGPSRKSPIGTTRLRGREATGPLAAGSEGCRERLHDCGAFPLRDPSKHRARRSVEAVSDQLRVVA